MIGDVSKIEATHCINNFANSMPSMIGGGVGHRRNINYCDRMKSNRSREWRGLPTINRSNKSGRLSAAAIAVRPPVVIQQADKFIHQMFMLV